MYGGEATFWLNLFLLLTVFVVLMTVFNALLRRWLGVEKPRAFSHNHVNDQHKKIDWSIRIFFIAVMVLGFFINIPRLPDESYLFLEPWFLLFGLVFITEIVRALMERKYAKNPNAYIYTISQLVFILVILTLLFTTDFLGFF
ncbi:hypothetical protein Plano_1026 [Planococcus sp. PAMC 21323]|uniref:DUF4181 domain-containing protein n=1 Tax=Planococcus sp. PAMC 21323 TaxID=1526927 RepID=UPI00056E5B38|nr:DUF4181 domain-containing protein [Planococcus sp. PAMC 21323]AIY04991.1 hypothetical protein Plano_1026 [Planococcus sp. PAMC 21323]